MKINIETRGNWAVATIPGDLLVNHLDVADFLTAGDGDTAKIFEKIDASGNPITVVFIKDYRLKDYRP